MKKNGNYVIHPFLFAIFPVLSLFSHNKEQVLLSELLWPVLLVLGLTIILILLSRLVFVNSIKQGIMVSLFMFLFFSYGHLRPVVVTVYSKLGILSIEGGVIQPGTIVLIFVMILLVVCFFFLKKTRSKLRLLNSYLNLVSLSLVIICLFTIIAYEFRTKRLFRAAANMPDTGRVEKAHASENELPDIYYLIFDRYTSTSALLEYFDFDNTGFINYLKGNGFYVAEHSRANYLSTWRSLASSLNMEHITNLVDCLGEDYTDMTILYEMVKSNKVVKFLKDRGYTYVLVGSVGGATRRGGLVDLCFNYSFGLSLSDFNLQLVELSIIHPVIVKITVGDARKFARKRILYQFRKLTDIPSIDGPKFTFAHILVPHDPYVFDVNGELPEAWQVAKRSDKENYLNQLIFTNTRITVLIDKLLSESKRPPIIILQSDEGAHDVGFSDDIDLMTHTQILNACYLPGIDTLTLYSSMTPVNTFRVVLNLYFGTDYKLLPDRTYHAPDRHHPFRFIDITEEIR